MSLTAPLRRLTSFFFLLALAFATTACFKPYTVIQQSGPPSALAGTTAMAVQFDYGNIAISNKRMSEQQWLDTREKDEHRNTYLETKNSANVGIIEGLQKHLQGVAISEGQAPAGGIQITVSYTFWEEGMYAGVVAWPSQVTARVIFTRDGEKLDEIEVNNKEDASLVTPAPQQRIHTIGQRLGQYTASFVNSSLAGEG